MKRLTHIRTRSSTRSSLVPVASSLGAWALDRLGHLTTVFELSTLTRGRVMHYAIPEQLKKDYGVTGSVPRTHRWTPPPATVS
jgi:hypothetical protein